MQKFLKNKVLPQINGQGLKAKAIRGSFWTIVSIGGKQFTRLLSNIILTRILFPEAFGIMALVNAFMYGLQMFSDLGTGASIIQNKKGDDEKFLNTAWTLQAARGGVLFFCACLLAWPMAQLYDQNILMQIIPVVGVSAIVSGFNPTSIVTANRHVELGRVTLLTLAAQIASVIILVILAFWLRSVWALAIGAITSALLQLFFFTCFMHGKRNKFCWDKEMGSEIFHFGKWIFVSTLCAFMINQGDRLILGIYLDPAQLGIYSIAFMLAVLPTSLTITISSKVLFPLYRQLLQSGEEFRQKIFKTRFSISFVFVSMSIFLAFIGPYLIDFLYDERYHTAKGMITVLSVAMIPRVVLLTSGQIPVAAGDSKGYALSRIVISFSQTLLMIIGGYYWGIVAIAVSFGLSMLVSYPVLALTTKRHGGWMPKHDVPFLFLGILLGSLAIWFHWADIAPLFLTGATDLQAN